MAPTNLMMRYNSDTKYLEKSTNAGSSFSELDLTGMTLGMVPIGAMLMWGTATAPTKWLKCDGAAVSRTTYAALFAIIGITFGAGDTTTTFNLPNYQGKFPFGKDTGGTGSTLGGTFGAKDHDHTSAAHTHTSAIHLHAVSIASGNNSAGQFVSSASPNDQNVASNTHTHSVSGNTGNTTPADTGSTTPGNTGTNNPPGLAVNFIIFAGV